MIRRLFIILFVLNSMMFFAQEVESSKTSVEVNETFPVYRGCHKKKSNKEIKKCTTRKIRDFFKMSFDIELANQLFPQDKTAKVLVEFSINEKGKIEKINAKANKREMAVEAIKVMKRLPKLKKPGYLNGEPIVTPFSIEMTVYF